MDGTIATISLDGLKIHVYTPPEESLLVNSTVFELAGRLIVVDGQIFQRLAREVGDLIDSLGKPVDRFVLTHNHPDHYSGFQHLTERFPGVQLAALPAVRDYLARMGQQVLDLRRSLFGDEVASRVVVPDAVIVPGELVISGVRFLFQEFAGAEADYSLTITLPDHGVALVADLLASQQHHLFTVAPHFDEWIDAVNRIRADGAKFGLTTIIVGHGAPVGPEVLSANLEYGRQRQPARAHPGHVAELVQPDALRSRRPVMLSFATAERLAAAALREGMRRRTSYIRPQIAIGKAWGALSLGVSSRAVAGIADRVPAFFQALTVAAQGRMFPAPGGVLLRGENGEIIGAVGVSGDSSDVDEAVGIAAAHEAGLGTEPPRSAA